MCTIMYVRHTREVRYTPGQCFLCVVVGKVLEVEKLTTFNHCCVSFNQLYT